MMTKLFLDSRLQSLLKKIKANTFKYVKKQKSNI